MTNNPERKARKKLREKRAKYEKDPSPSLLEEIHGWEERIETLLKCRIDGKKKMAKVENLEKTDDEILMEALAYNEEHKDDPDVREKQENVKNRQKIEKDRHYRRIEISRMKAKKTEEFEKEIEDYKKGKEEFETMKKNAMKEIMEKENINKYDASKRFKEEYDKHIEYTRMIQEISKEQGCSKEEAENIFKQVVTQMKANAAPVQE